MIIGIPKEIKIHEYRVGAPPAMVRGFVDKGHTVLVQTQAGAKIGFSDDDYQSAGAKIVHSAAEIYNCEMILKVKEPQPAEYDLLKKGQILFCYLHLAPDHVQTKVLVEKQVIAIAYETVTDPKGRLPLLIPMSEVAGRVAIQAGATALQMNFGGKGLLLGGVPGVSSANVVVIGGGVAGTEAARMAVGMGANVTIFDKNVNRLRELDALYNSLMQTLYSSPAAIEKALITADLVIGAVLIPGKTAPKVVTREMVKKMGLGSVLVDISIDQGGCFETSRPTTSADPTYVVDGVVHYCVTNMPSTCARTSTMALTNVTGDYAFAIAKKGYRQALIDDPYLRVGLNVCLGKVTNQHVAEDLGYEYVSPETALGIA